MIVNLALHGLVFGEGNTGDPDALYLTAGMAGGLNGVFGAVSVNTGGGAPDFSLTASPRSVTVAAGTICEVFADSYTGSRIQRRFLFHMYGANGRHLQRRNQFR